ncbi:hypothetical protein ID849_16085, partial [Xenorhabdus sp. 3]|uniref:hypothetical protein n=1 Tax=Xenorhabdus doucetiae TaxID=351671 RepID=UPI0019A3B6A3
MDKNKEMPEKKAVLSVTTQSKKDTYQVTPSLDSGFNVFIGQQIYLKVTVTSPAGDLSSLNKIHSIVIKDPTNSIRPNTYNPYSFTLNGGDGYGEVTLILTIDKATSPHEISFVISAQDKKGKPVTGFPDKTVTYNVIDNTPEDLIILKTESEFIATLTTANPINDKNSKFNLYSGTVNDGNNNPISNIQVLIIAQQY